MSDTKKLNIEFAQKLQQAWGDFSAAVEAEMTTLHEEAIIFSATGLDGRIKAVSADKFNYIILQPLGIIQTTSIDAHVIISSLEKTTNDFRGFDEATAQKFVGEWG